MDSTGHNDSAFQDAAGSLSTNSAAGSPPQEPGEKGVLSRVFRNSTEVRAGWRLLIFLSVFIAASAILAFMGRGFIRISTHHFTPLTLAMGDGVALLAALAAAGVMAALEHRSFYDYGLPWRSAFQAQFWFGAVWGWAALTLLLLLIRLYRGFDFGGPALHSWRAVFYYATVWALAFLVVGFFEEFFFRGYALYTLASGIGFWPAAVALSLVFGAVHLHNPGEDWMGGLTAGLIGFFLCFTVRRTGNLWFAIGLHAVWDYFETFVYSVPDSGFVPQGHLLDSSLHGSKWLTGGSVGPEASLFVFIVVVNLFVVFNLLYPKARYPGIATSPELVAAGSSGFGSAQQ